MRQCRSDCLFPILRTAWAACRAECKQTLSTCRRLSLSRTAPVPRRSYQRERERERAFVQEGNRAPVSKAIPDSAGAAQKLSTVMPGQDCLAATPWQDWIGDRMQSDQGLLPGLP